MNGEQQVPPDEANEIKQPESAQAAPDGGEAEPADEASRASPEQVDPLQAVSEERDRLKDQLLRTAADFENFRKRSRRDVEEARARSKEDTLREVLPIIDNLERAVAASADATGVESIREGIRMVLRLFEDTASRLGLERVPSEGERFDPNVHEAIQQAESAEHPPGMIISEAVPGYKLGERLLRAALVVVSRGPGPQSSAS